MATVAITSTPLTLAPLPYPIDALAPIISSNTLRLHHGQHHRTYVETASKLIAGTELAQMSLEQIVMATAGSSDRMRIFNNAAQA
jgi:Fe-Mn family superoxide dismutase